MTPDRQRLLDIIAAVLLLLVSAPLLLTIAALVKISSPGPVFCRQRRFSRGGKTFRVLQFRLTVAVQNGGPSLAVAGKRRLTPIGKVLRHTRLEALPQLISVLRGETSLFGMRPQPAEFDDWDRHFRAWRPAQ